VAKNIDHWYKHNLHDNNENTKNEERIISQINKILKKQWNHVTKADKGNPIIILKITDCDN
jgi:hypothetical protein